MGFWKWMFGLGGACERAAVVEEMERRVLLAADCPVIDDVSADNRGLVVMHVDRDLMASTVNQTSVKIFTAGADGLLDTADDIDTNASVSYDADADTITVDGAVDADTRYMLVVDGSSVMATNGRLLDGEFNGADSVSGDGVEGGDYKVFSRDPATLIARYRTSSGIIDIELLQEDAPITVANFLRYVNEGIYDGTFFHRAAETNGMEFVIQGGGFSSSTLDALENFGPIMNEFGNSNVRGTVAMAKLGGDPDSASNQWFFNLSDNSENLDNQNGGFTVFARVVDSTGFETIDAIADLETVDASGQGSAFGEVPVNDADEVDMNGGTVTQDDLVVVSRISVLVDLSGEAFGQLDDTGALVVTNNAGTVTVTIYDLAQSGLVQGSEDSVRISFDGRKIKSITFQDPFPDTPVGVYVQGATNVGSFRDNRRDGDGAIAFIASDSHVGSINFRGTLEGYDLNGFVLPGGLEIGEDADGDGDGDDLISVFVTGSLGSIKMQDGMRGSVITGEGLQVVRVRGTVYDADFNIGEDSSGRSATTFVFDRVQDTSIRTENDIRVIKAQDWREVENSDGMTIRADTLNALRITGNRRNDVEGVFNSDLVLRGAEDGNTLGSARVNGVILLSRWDISGDVGAMIVRGDVSQWEALIDGDTGPIRADSIISSDIRANGFVRNIRAAEVDNSIIVIGAARAVQITGNRREDIDGDYTGSFIVTGSSEDLDVRTFTVRGDYAEGALDINGSVRNILIGGEIRDATLEVEADVNLVRAKQVSNVQMTFRGEANRVQAENWFDGLLQGQIVRNLIMTGNRREGSAGDFYANTLVNRIDTIQLQRGGSLNGDIRLTATVNVFIDGDVIDSRINYNSDLGATQRVFSNWDIRGGMMNSQMFALSSMGNITVGWMEDSGIFAGATEAAFGLPDRDDLPVDGNVSATYRVDRSIDSLTIRGIQGEASFINSTLFAGTLGNATIVRPETENFGTPFGLTFGAVEGAVVTHFEDGQVRVRSNDSTPPAEGDYQVRVDFQQPENA